jgi:WD40 repeat protein
MDQPFNTTVARHDGWITGIEQLRPGVIASSASDGILRVWDLASGE